MVIQLDKYRLIGKRVEKIKKVNRKVQGVPQSQNAANPRHREKEKWQKLTRTKQTNAREAHRPAPSYPNEVIKMLKGMTKHEDKEHGKTLKHEASSNINHKATQNKNNTGTTALGRSVG